MKIQEVFEKREPRSPISSNPVAAIGVRNEILEKAGILLNKYISFAAFAQGERDARDGLELSVAQKFFEIQSPEIKEFVLVLNISVNDQVLGSIWLREIFPIHRRLQSRVFMVIIL